MQKQLRRVEGEALLVHIRDVVIYEQVRSIFVDL